MAGGFRCFPAPGERAKRKLGGPAGTGRTRQEPSGTRQNPVRTRQDPVRSRFVVVASGWFSGSDPANPDISAYFFCSGIEQKAAKDTKQKNRRRIVGISAGERAKRKLGGPVSESLTSIS